MNTPAATKTDLLLLGLLLDRPMHGYELYQQIQAEGIDGWFNVSAAGVYYSLGKLRDLGLVAESRQHGGRSPRKSIYRLVEKGRSAFFATLEDQLASQEKSYLDYDLVVFLLNKLPKQRAIPRLEQRLEFLMNQTSHVQAALESEKRDALSPLKLAILDHKRRFLEMEQEWLADVIDGVQDEGDALGSPEGERRGLMMLSGDLRHYHLPNLIRLIISGQHSGTLTITDGAETGTLSFDSGRPVYASFLRRSEPAVPNASLDQVLNALCDLFRQQEGRFDFDQRIDPQDWWFPLEMSAEELMLRGCRKVDNWSIIQHLVPSAGVIFELAPDSRGLEQLSLTPNEERVIATLDGAKDVTAIARELDMTLFEASRVLYCLTAIGMIRTADLDKIRLRRVFREIAELMCDSTLAWRTDPDCRSCEDQVNERCRHLPVRLVDGHIEDHADPQLGIDELTKAYCSFLEQQYRVVRRRFGHSEARRSFERSLLQLAPELQDTARRHGFDRLPMT
jgi:DNA-binding PadR family transcriptional regulator